MTTTIATDPQIIAALLTVALTAIAGTSGYFLREWLTRTKPFVAVLRVEGATKQFSARVQIPRGL
jgi:hypothetical protein